MKFPSGEETIKNGLVIVRMILVLGLFLLPGRAAAVSPADMERLKATSECPNCNLNGANLGGANLDNANLSGAYLGGANLSKANLSAADLVDADLTGAKLNKAYLGGAKLGGAILDDALLSGAIWIDGTKCREGSVKSCTR